MKDIATPKATHSVHTHDEENGFDSNAPHGQNMYGISTKVRQSQCTKDTESLSDNQDKEDMEKRLGPKVPHRQTTEIGRARKIPKRQTTRDGRTHHEQIAEDGKWKVPNGQFAEDGKNPNVPHRQTEGEERRKVCNGQNIGDGITPKLPNGQIAEDGKYSNDEVPRKTPQCQIHRTVFIVMCLVVAGTSAMSFSFNAYSSASKAWFNMTQVEVETLASVTFISAAFNLPAGLFYDTYGILPAMLMGMVVYTGGWGLVWAATVATSYVSSHAWILSVLITIAGHGRTYLFITSITASVSVVKATHRSLMLVVSETVFDTGTLLYAFIYQTFFVHGHVIDAENQNLSGFFMFVVGWTLVVGVVGTVVMSHYVARQPVGGEGHDNNDRTEYDEIRSHISNGSNDNVSKRNRSYISNGSDDKYFTGDDEDIQNLSKNRSSSETAKQLYNTEEIYSSDKNNELSTMNKKSQSTGGINNNIDDDNEWQMSNGVRMLAKMVDKKQASDGHLGENTHLVTDNSGGKSHTPTLLTMNYQLILWSVAIPCGIAAFTAFNIAFITRSLYLSDYDYYLVVFHRLFVVIGRLGFGLPTAVVKQSKVVAEVSVLITNAIVLVLQVALVMIGENAVIMFFVVLGTAVSHGALYLLGPILVAEYFGLNKFGTNISVITSLVPVLTMMIGILFAKLYEMEISTDGGNYCYGKKCISTSVCINVGLAGLGTTLAAIQLWRKSYKNIHPKS